MHLKVIVFQFVLVFSTICGLNAQGLNLRGGHSHNDYSRQRPLFEALENGLISIEADIFPVGEQLLVAHNPENLQEEKTLEAMYLVPLRKLAEEHKISNLILLIDIKTDAERSYQLLKQLFAKYDTLLTLYSEDSIHLRTISVILSGERPFSILKEKNRYAALDGRFDDISFKYGFTYFPLISEDWNKLFTWKGQLGISYKEKIALDELVKKCHSQHKLIRFWGLPTSHNETVQFWELFKNSKVDLLGVDNPSAFNTFSNPQK